MKIQLSTYAYFSNQDIFMLSICALTKGFQRGRSIAPTVNDDEYNDTTIKISRTSYMPKGGNLEFFVINIPTPETLKVILAKEPTPKSLASDPKQDPNHVRMYLHLVINSIQCLLK